MLNGLRYVGSVQVGSWDYSYAMTKSEELRITQRSFRREV